MKKSIIINNPNSSNYLVKLNSNQNVKLILNEELFPKYNFEIKSNHLIVEKNDSILFVEQNTESIKHYQNFSNFHLGEIKINSKKNNSNLIFVLNNTNPLKENILTVLSPKKTQIKIVPGDILEFVLLDNFLINDKIIWNFTYKNGCFFNILEESFFDKNQSNDPQNFSYSKISRTSDKRYSQKHFWFSLGKNAYRYLSSNAGTQNVANLTFVCERTNSFFDCDIFVNFNKKYKLKFLKSLLLKNSQTTKPISAKIKKINFDLLEQGCNSLPVVRYTKTKNYYDFLE